VIAFAGQAHKLHDPPYAFVRGALGPPYERPTRVAALRVALDDLGLKVLGPTTHGLEEVLATHDEGLVTFLRSGWVEARAQGAPEVVIPDIFAHARLLPVAGWRPAVAGPALPGSMCFDCSSPLLEGTWTAAKEAADLALSAATAIDEGSRHAYALCRPPGHHAGRDYYGGFCYLNNSAIAARHFQRLGRRVAVLDLDIHHGNGTQAIFWDDSDVLAISIHQHPTYGYPYFTGYLEEEGGEDALGANLNLTLDAGCNDTAYQEVFSLGLARLESFAPDLLVVPLGLDGHVADPLSQTRLTAAGYAACGRRLAELGIPVLVIQEGGYATDVLRESLRGFLAALIGP
jgi:acetoin utilization deacetylase AcuC-like enzyme